MKNKKSIGLLGGSFNPPHQGHIDMSLHALTAFSLDEVWWLVTPKNPLKNLDLYKTSYEDRILACQKIVAEVPISIKNYEEQHKTSYSFEIIDILLHNYPEHKFIWIMGADSFLTFHKWKNWKKISKNIVLAIFPRPGYNENVVFCKAARSLVKYRCHHNDVKTILTRPLPCWTFMETLPQNPLSSTLLRKQGKELKHI